MSIERKRRKPDESELYSGAYKQSTLLICHDAVSKLRSMRLKIQVQGTRIFDQNVQSDSKLYIHTTIQGVSIKMLEYDWLLAALIYSLIDCFRSKLSDLTCPITNIIAKAAICSADLKSLARLNYQSTPFSNGG